MLDYHQLSCRTQASDKLVAISSKTALTAQVSCCSISSGSRSSRSKRNAAGHAVQAQQWQHQGALWDANTRSRAAKQACVRGWQAPASCGCARPSWPGCPLGKGVNSFTQQGEDRQGGIRLRERLLAAGERPRPPLRLLQRGVARPHQPVRNYNTS